MVKADEDEVTENGTSTKFKVRGSRFFYTLVKPDEDEAEKLKHGEHADQEVEKRLLVHHLSRTCNRSGSRTSGTKQ